MSPPSASTALEQASAPQTMRSRQSKALTCTQYDAAESRPKHDAASHTLPRFSPIFFVITCGPSTLTSFPVFRGIWTSVVGAVVETNPSPPPRRRKIKLPMPRPSSLRKTWSHRGVWPSACGLAWKHEREAPGAYCGGSAPKRTSRSICCLCMFVPTKPTVAWSCTRTSRFRR
eukprot:682642-Rhodomonas_salina.1